MKRLNEMDDVTRLRCKKCDYMNNDVAVSEKIPNCKGIENQVNCELFRRTAVLDYRIKYLKGEIGPIFFREYIDTFKD